MTLRSTKLDRSLGPRPSTPTSGVLIEALFALVTLSATAMSAWVIGRARADERASTRDGRERHASPDGNDTTGPRASPPAHAKADGASGDL